MILLFLTPILVSLCLILFFKKSSQLSGLLGIACAMVMSFMMPELNMSFSVLEKTLLNACILSLSALCVILPGLTMSSILENGGYNHQARHFLNELAIPLPQKVLILMFGLLPAIESITGFGISLILAAPLFFGLFKPKTAEKLSMLSMNIMPWGTLGLATLVGAQISGYTMSELGVWSSYFILPIFLFLSNLVLYIIKKKDYSVWDFCFAFVLSCLFCAVLYTCNQLQLVEISGVIAGMTVFFVFFCFLILRNSGSFLQEITRLLSAIMPYLFIILLLIVNKFLLVVVPELVPLSTIHGHGVKFSLASSPLFAISLAALAIAHYKKLRIEVPIAKTYRACSVLFIFIFLAQLMNFSGFIQGMASYLHDQNNEIILKVISPVLAMLSGFITGSNLGGNALLMSIQQNIGASIDNPLLFSAIQNVGAGYAVFASMPIIILIKTIVENSTQIKVDERRMLHFGMQGMAAIYLILLIMTLFA